MKLQRGQELRQLVIYPSGGLASDEELLYFVLGTIVVDMECVEMLGLITARSSHIPEPCAARDRASARHPVMMCTLRLRPHRALRYVYYICFVRYVCYTWYTKCPHWLRFVRDSQEK